MNCIEQLLTKLFPPKKNVDQDSTFFFCSVDSDVEAFLLPEQPPAKAGAEIRSAAQRRAEMRNIGKKSSESILASQTI